VLVEKNVFAVIVMVGFAAGAQQRILYVVATAGWVICAPKSRSRIGKNSQ
jgi:hypothetical protein